MTARVTTLKGASAGAYYVEALPSYYLDSGEPKGVWHGRGAELLGLHGELIDDEFLAVMAGLRPGTDGEVHLGRVMGDSSVRGFDVTASAPKSVSVMFAVGDDDTRRHVLEAHDTAVRVMIDWIETHAHTRFRITGQVSVVDAEGIVAAAFRQHTSRALDPQLHTHVVVSNRVRSPDRRWLALDARSLMLDQRTLSAIYHSTLRSQLSGRLGVVWEPAENGIAEISGIPEAVLEEFSSRTLDVQRRIDAKLDRFIDTFERQPTPRERWRLEREAVIDSRPLKATAVDGESLHEGWTRQADATGFDPYWLVADVVGPPRAQALDTDIASAAVKAAVDALVERQSSWRPAELTREIAATLPTDIAIDPAEIVGVLDSLTSQAIAAYCVDISRPVPDGVAVRRDGRPFAESVADRAITTPEILAQEERLTAWAQRRLADPGLDSTTAPDLSSRRLTAPQAQTAAAVAGTADLVLVVGPAGTGKTTALAPAVAQLQAEGRPVFGVAPSAAAADVLGSETGVGADTIDKLLVEHSGRRPPDHRYDLPAGSTIIVDEAGMIATDRFDRLAELADTKAWRIALVGDPLQFSAVGRGGMFQFLLDAHGGIELDQVHRFINQWERDASLQLRQGDPAVAKIYDLHDRLHGGTLTRMTGQALDEWWTARHNGDNVVLAAPTNDTIINLNRAAQQMRLDAGELDPRGRTTEAGPARYQIHVGDEIVTRQNDRQIRTDRGLAVHNRDRWHVDTVHRNGDITAYGTTGRVRLPAGYVADHVELGYAQTSHATQGRTVDRSILLLDTPCDVRGIYVPMTRGREHNSAYIVTTGEQTPADVFAESIARSWIDQPALARQTELTGQNLHKPGGLPAVELRTLLRTRTDLNRQIGHINNDSRQLPRQMAQLERAKEQAVSQLGSDRSRLKHAHDTLAAHDRPLRRRGHEIEIANAHRAADYLPADIDKTAAKIAELDTKITDLHHKIETNNKLSPSVPQLQKRLDNVNDRLHDDFTVRRRQNTLDPPAHVTNQIGERPTGGHTADAWDRAAAQIDQHITAFGPAKFLQSGSGLPHPAARESHAITGGLIRGLRDTRSRELDGPSLGIGR
ncbi:MAG: relaxase domain-containing protein [Acidimicrobiales bacterium]|nr:relaxase domain-containing protein [Acidimicrobiales bacterium]